MLNLYKETVRFRLIITTWNGDNEHMELLHVDMKKKGDGWEGAIQNDASIEGAGLSRSIMIDMSERMKTIQEVLYKQAKKKMHIPWPLSLIIDKMDGGL